MVYTQVEMTPQTPENHMKKQGNNSPPRKKPRTMYTLDYTQVYTSEARNFRKAHPRSTLCQSPSRDRDMMMIFIGLRLRGQPRLYVSPLPEIVT